MKELFRLNQHLLGGHYDLWVVMKKEFNRDNSERIEKLFLNTLNEINNR